MSQLRIACLGDSLTQGFMSGAISRTELSYPAMIAGALGLRVVSDFRVPRFPGDGLPLNLEGFLRDLDDEVGADVSTLEWIFEFPQIFHRYLDAVEDLYERGAGAAPAKSGRIYHNLAVWGFTVREALELTGETCRRVMDDEEGFVEDDFLGLPSAPMYRTGRRVLNPRQLAARDGDSQVDSLRKLIEQEGALDAAIVWLGANDCLGTVLELRLRDMAEADGPIPGDTVERRKHWNLTSAEQFRADYEALAAELDRFVTPATPVFVGTVPHVTIPPVTTGIPPKGADGYFAHYARFFIDGESFDPLLHAALSREEAIRIDQRIDAFNAAIRDAVEARGHWHLVDTCAILDRLAVKRNHHEADPGEALRRLLADRGDHPLLHLDPVPSILMLQTDEEGDRERGGLISLDGVHPTTIGYGLVAEAFLTAMQQAGVPGADPARLDWPRIIASDTLLQAPPLTWDDVVDAAHRHTVLWDLVFRVIF